MIRMRTHAATLAVCIAALAGTAIAGGHNLTPEQQAMKARQSHMGLYAFNLGILGAMAKGDVEYNADAAAAAANNLATLATLNQAAYWLPGSDADSLEGSRALPAIWDNVPDVMEKSTSLASAAQALAVAAGSGDPAALGPAIGPLGKACNDCHESYQQTR